MKRLFAWWVMGLVGISFTGCSRLQTKIVQKPRVDQQITQGHNKGYLKGSGPAGGERRTTRELLETDVELPTWQEMNPWYKGKQEAAPEAVAAAPAPVEPAPSRGWEAQKKEGEYNIPPSEIHAEVTAGGTEYTVQKGDTLQKIAKKFYGSSKNWYKIYKANKGVLKSPNAIRPGQTLTIPSLGKTVEEPSNEYK